MNAKFNNADDNISIIIYVPMIKRLRDRIQYQTCRSSRANYMKESFENRILHHLLKQPHFTKSLHNKSDYNNNEIK